MSFFASVPRWLKVYAFVVIFVSAGLLVLDFCACANMWLKTERALAVADRILAGEPCPGK